MIIYCDLRFDNKNELVSQNFIKLELFLDQ